MERGGGYRMKRYKLIVGSVCMIVMLESIVGCKADLSENSKEEIHCFQSESSDKKNTSDKQENTFKPSKTSSQQGQLEIELDFYRGCTSASNQYAVWIENAQGEVIKTLYVSRFTAEGGYQVRKECVPTWVEHAKVSEIKDEEIDVISGATPRTGQQCYYWDGTDKNGNKVKNGKYIFYVEGTLYWSSRVLFSGTVEMGASTEKKIEVKTSYTENIDTNRDMIQNVAAKYIFK